MLDAFFRIKGSTPRFKENVAGYGKTTIFEGSEAPWTITHGRDYLGFASNLIIALSDHLLGCIGCRPKIFIEKGY
jgi:hypothetical protein